MKTVLSYATPKVLAGGALVLLFLGYVFFVRDSSSSIQTFPVSRGEFKEEVSVSGTVVAARRVDLGFTQSGRVARVLTDEGQMVQAGALLAEIDNQDLYASLEQKQAALASQEAKLASLQAGTRPEEIAVAQAEVDSDIDTLTQTNSALVDAIRTVYTKADDAIRNDVYQFVSNARTANPSLTFFTNDNDLSTRFVNEIPSVEVLLKKWAQSTATAQLDGASSVASAMQYESNAISALLSDASAVLVRGIPSGSITQTNLNTYASDVATGRSAFDTAVTALTTAITAQKNAASALATAKKNLALKEAGTVQSDIDAQAAQVDASKAEVLNAQAQFAKTRIYAPFSGVVTNVDAEVGKIVSPNTPEISMISSGVLQIETFIPEISVVDVAVGQSADVTLDAYGSSVNFPAKVVSIDPAETVKNGVSTYKTTLQFDAPDERVRPGMTATVDIVTSTQPDVLTVPQGAVYARGDKHFVQVLVDKSAEEREVQLGKSSTLGSVVVTDGLSEGESVVLNPTQ